MYGRLTHCLTRGHGDNFPALAACWTEGRTGGGGCPATSRRRAFMTALLFRGVLCLTMARPWIIMRAFTGTFRCRLRHVTPALAKLPTLESNGDKCLIS